MAINDSSVWTPEVLDQAAQLKPKIQTGSVQTQVQPTATGGSTPPYAPGNPAPYITPGATPSYAGDAATVSAAPTGTTMPSGMDPALWAVYQNSGLTPSNTGGTGFADWQYWQGVGPSQYNRLASDIAGTGSDRPTGTPGRGAWSTSGASAGAHASMANLGPYAPAGTAPSFDGTVMSGTPSSNGLESLLASLTTRANQSLNVNPNDPIIRDQVNAFDASQTRSARTAEAQAAERGGAFANTGAETRSASEKASQNTAGFQASLMQNELTARRQEIQSALNGQQGILTAQQQTALQEELAKMDVALRNYQFGASQGQQESQFERNLAQGAYQFDTNSQFQNSPLYGG